MSVKQAANGTPFICWHVRRLIKPAQPGLHKKCKIRQKGRNRTEMKARRVSGHTRNWNLRANGGKEMKTIFFQF